MSEVSASSSNTVAGARTVAGALFRGQSKKLAAVTSMACVLTLLGLGANVGAQTTSTVAPASSTTIPTATLALVMEPVTGGSGISLSAPNAMRTTVVITNEAKVALTNQQMVVRFGVKPDLVNSVIDGSGPVGLIDQTTGAWFHTIAAIQPGERLTYSVNWFKYCAGKWPMAVRVGDRQISSTVQWSGTSADARCPADESINPQPPSFYALSWPSSISFTTATSLAVSSTSSVAPSSTAPVTVNSASSTSVSPGVTTSIVRPSTTIVTSSTLQSLGGPTTSPSSSTTPTSTTKLGGTTSTLPSSNRSTTTLFCKTVGGNKYCGPKSSAYKEGQEKAQELKPGQKPGPKAKAKAKSKARSKTTIKRR